MKKIIYLVRHSVTDWNENSRIQGRKDIPLNKRGKSETAILGEYLSKKEFGKIYTSPLKRATETAEIINQFQVIKKEIEKDDCLCEVDFGSATGGKYNEYAQGLRLMTIPDMEKIKDIQKRIASFLKKIETIDESIVIVSHSLIIKYILESFQITYESGQNAHGAINKLYFVDNNFITHKRVDVVVHSYE